MSTAAKKAPEKPDNLALWNALGKTDPAHTKGFKRAGGFTGTAIKPIWIIRRLTEQFGPCGVGWGIGEPRFEVVAAGDDTLVFCTVACWHGTPGNLLYGVGGDKCRGKNKNGPFSDDEAFKKAFTDAVGNAFKFVGVGADVHMGLFDDSKYVSEVAAEFSGPPANDGNGHSKGRDDPFPPGPAKNKTELKDKARLLWREIEGCGDPDELDALLKSKETIQLVNQLVRALPKWWEGVSKGDEQHEGLEAVISRKQSELALAAVNAG